MLKSAPLFTNPEAESKIYENVLRAVIWDENRDEIFQMLHANGIIGEQAEQMFRRARGERLATLRSEGFHRMMKGVLRLSAGIIVFCLFWYGMGFTLRNVMIACGVVSAWGLWCSAGGAMDILLAPTKRGSVAGGE